MQIIEDLEADSQVTTELRHHLFVSRDRPCHTQSRIQRGFEGRGRFQGVNLQRIQRGQVLLRCGQPRHFGTLAITQLEVRRGHPIDDIGSGIGSNIATG